MCVSIHQLISLPGSDLHYAIFVGVYWCVGVQLLCLQCCLCSLYTSLPVLSGACVSVSISQYTPHHSNCSGQKKICKCRLNHISILRDYMAVQRQKVLNFIQTSPSRNTRESISISDHEFLTGIRSI